MFQDFCDCPHMQLTVSKLLAEAGDHLARIVPMVLKTAIFVQRLIQ